jgi:hypothetical protein
MSWPKRTVDWRKLANETTSDQADRFRIKAHAKVHYENGAMTVGNKKRQYKFRHSQFSTTWWIATAVAIGWAVTIWQGS